MCKKIYNPKEAICLIIYCEEKTLSDISKRMYGKRNTRISDWIKELLKENKIVVKPNIDHIRKPYYQTKPEMLLNYINKILKEREKEFNRKKYDISLTVGEKAKVLNYLKSPHFNDFVNSFVSNMPEKSEHFTFPGLMEWYGMRCIHELQVKRFYQVSGEVDFDKIDIPPEYIKKGTFDFVKLPNEIIYKLTNLHHRAFMISSHYKTFVRMIDYKYQKTSEILVNINKKLRERIKQLEPSS